MTKVYRFQKEVDEFITLVTLDPNLTVKTEILQSNVWDNWFLFESQPIVLKGKSTKMYCMSAIVELANTIADKKQRSEILKTQKLKNSELTTILA